MSVEEFWDALKYICSKEGDIPKGNENNNLPPKSFWDSIKSIYSKEENSVLENVAEEQEKNFFEEVKDIVTFKWFSDFIDWWKVPLTKDVFIERGKYFKKWLYDTVETIVFVLVAVIIIRFFIGEIRWIPSGSMHPTLLEGDRIFVERYSRFYTTPKRGDIMVFYPPSTNLSKAPLAVLSRLTGIFCKDIAYIKRVIGLPGENIEIKFDTDGSAYVYINGELYEEKYIQSVYEYPMCPPKLFKYDFVNDARIMKCGPFKLKDDEYFMMGDNRGNSQDSRYWGPLKQDRFIGRATYIFWPLTRAKKLHRTKRQARI